MFGGNPCTTRTYTGCFACALRLWSTISVGRLEDIGGMFQWDCQDMSGHKPLLVLPPGKKWGILVCFALSTLLCLLETSIAQLQYFLGLSSLVVFTALLLTSHESLAKTTNVTATYSNKITNITIPVPACGRHRCSCGKGGSSGDSLTISASRRW
jgi:hypothetical protein